MKIVIVDDDILVSSALKTILEAGGEVEVTGTGQDGKDAVRLYDELLPDVLLMDIRMKDMNGLDAAEQILKMHTDAKILLLTTFSDDEYIVKALKYGVKGYLIKQDYGSILPALQAVQMNQTVFGTAIMSRIPGLLQKEQKEKEQTFDWNSLTDIDRDGRLFVLAGGLTPDNVRRAIEQVHPDVVDVSSGIEYDVVGGAQKPGKDPEKMRLMKRNIAAWQISGKSDN